MSNSIAKLLTSKNKNQYVLSYELLALVQWLVDQNAQELKNLIKDGIQNGGLKNYINNHVQHEATNQEDNEMSIVDFFSLLEQLLTESLHEDSAETIHKRNLLPEIGHLDLASYDEAILQKSMKEATDKLEKNPAINLQETLFKELLKQLHPKKNSHTVN